MHYFQIKIPLYMTEIQKNSHQKIALLKQNVCHSLSDDVGL